ncbi:hypothetical protein BDV96DRAFT_586501 [Lophiotrema nucula]|uniref:Uncharacterized protein n=1 Tax=Lophiotrema nucula TaxID=690887 RepID=A0A6A5YPK6_9PLEO|nr:hypothetical protein BDV96DRAFT_586501 [Lophiotrema nucula]
MFVRFETLLTLLTKVHLLAASDIKATPCATFGNYGRQSSIEALQPQPDHIATPKLECPDCEDKPFDAYLLYCPVVNYSTPSPCTEEYSTPMDSIDMTLAAMTESTILCEKCPGTETTTATTILCAGIPPQTKTSTLTFEAHPTIPDQTTASSISFAPLDTMCSCLGLLVLGGISILLALL